MTVPSTSAERSSTPKRLLVALVAATATCVLILAPSSFHVADTLESPDAHRLGEPRSTRAASHDTPSTARPKPPPTVAADPEDAPEAFSNERRTPQETRAATKAPDFAQFIAASRAAEVAAWTSDAPLGKADIAKYAPGEPLEEFSQIHHGIYKCRGKRSKVRYAIKTECRPAAKWHGQQGWTEVAVHHLSRLVFGKFNTVPPAVGGVVTLSLEQASHVHRDGCGKDIGQVSDGAMRSAAMQLAVDDRDPLIGVILEWRPKHDDEALDHVIKKRNLAYYWQTSTLEAEAKAAGGNYSADSAGRKPKVKRKHELGDVEYVKQISDIAVLDYLIENEDREDKNWFTVPVTDEVRHGPRGSQFGLNSNRFVAMDNGWAFVGRGYKTSVCGEDESNLVCPPLLRHLSGSSKCRDKKRSGTPAMQNCRFREHTVDRIREATGSSWKQSIRREWLQTLRGDPLFRWLSEQYGAQGRDKTVSGSIDRARDDDGSQYSEALARFVQNCPTNATDAGSSLAALADGKTRDEVREVLLGWLATGVHKRLKRLKGHIDACVERFGEDPVFMRGLD